MRARLRQGVEWIADSFWALPGAMVLGLGWLGWFVVWLQQAERIPDWLPQEWVYGGGKAGARELLGAIATSTIAVAGTIFSITIAALIMASNQMGPRLLRHFMRDRGNQLTLGVFLGAFAYALMVLRSVRGGDEDGFVPGLGVSLALALAAACVGMLVYFVHHVASRINVDTVVGLVYGELVASIDAATCDEPGSPSPDPAVFADGEQVTGARSGMLQNVDVEALADWAVEHRVQVKLLVRPGEFVVPGAAVAVVAPRAEGAREAVGRAMALTARGQAPMDALYSIRQLVEVAVRALSPGINDPLTAMSVIDRLGAVLCRLAGRELPTGVTVRQGRAVLVARVVDYHAIVEAMFPLIRQSAGRTPAVLQRLMQVLHAAALQERRPDRLEVLRRQALLTFEDGRNNIDNVYELEALEAAYREVLAASGPAPSRTAAAPT